MNAAVMTPQLQLPWETRAQDEQRFGKILGSCMAVFLVLAVAMPWLPLQELTKPAVEEPPQILARVILEKKELPKPLPPKVQPKPKPKPIAKTEPVKPRTVTTPKPIAKPIDKVAEARKAAAVAGVLAFQDDLQDMRDTVDINTLEMTQTSRGVETAAQTQRAIVTATARANSGGIQTAALSTNTGGPALSARQTTTVQSTIAGKGGKQRVSSQTAQMGGRSDESIRKIMDTNKGAIFAIYNRALRKDPLLEGKLVFEMVIDAAGNIEALTLLSSELIDEALTQKILSRITLIRFGQEQVISTRVNYSFDFLPFT